MRKYCFYIIMLVVVFISFIPLKLPPWENHLVLLGFWSQEQHYSTSWLLYDLKFLRSKMSKFTHIWPRGNFKSQSQHLKVIWSSDQVVESYSNTFTHQGDLYINLKKYDLELLEISTRLENQKHCYLTAGWPPISKYISQRGNHRSVRYWTEKQQEHALTCRLVS